MFPQNLPKAANLVPAHVEMGLADLLARGLVTCDSFGGAASDDHAALAPPRVRCGRSGGGAAFACASRTCRSSR